MKKIAICPKCNTKIFCEGDPGQKKIIQCENCGGKGFISFIKEDKKRTLEDLETKISKKPATLLFDLTLLMPGSIKIISPTPSWFLFFRKISLYSKVVFPAPLTPAITVKVFFGI